MPKIVASLFSGCGGLDLGFTGGFDFRGHQYERLDTHIVFANDFDQDAYNCYNSNHLLTMLSLIGSKISCTYYCHIYTPLCLRHIDKHYYPYWQPFWYQD